MLDPFDQKKQLILKEIGDDTSVTKDLSPKGSIDEPCIPIINLINAHPNMVTTSSCSGRVSVFIEGIKDREKIGSKGNQGHWIYVNHHPDIENWYKTIDYKINTQSTPTNELTRYILYKFEPLILHVKCRDLDSANELYKVAMSCGFRESGIGTNNIVAIRISIKLDIPIGYYDEEVVFNVDETYLDFVTKLAKDRFTENFRKLDQLYDAIKVMGVVEKKVVETKEERRERKIREGLAKQALKKSQE
ncbi:tRNA wybutosine-synthesizing protein 3 [[Candida] jaroonii]|uniref:tRNA wybutosine-synthesizing protein 3 n=1 Tax=[Candida] jaroonii TaxID=467808 RepID=A0ACA9YF36_9ASCO|nr:tRNA wybutosine-synthesizing protein 3 [[Candida] jaroonii]